MRFISYKLDKKLLLQSCFSSLRTVRSAKVMQDGRAFLFHGYVS